MIDQTKTAAVLFNEDGIGVAGVNADMLELRDGHVLVFYKQQLVSVVCLAPGQNILLQDIKDVKPAVVDDILVDTSKEPN